MQFTAPLSAAAAAAAMPAPAAVATCLDGSVPVPLAASRIAATKPVARGESYHYTGCGCGERPWCGATADCIWQEVLVPRQLSSDTLVLLPPDPATAAVNDICTNLVASLGARRHLLAGAPTPPPASNAVDLPLFDPSALPARTKASAPLRIAYFIPHHNVTGGMKMIVRQIDLLSARGHKVQAVFRGPPGSPVLPPWAADTAVDSVRLLGAHESVAQVFRDNDVLVIGYFTQLLEFVAVTERIGPIVYWDQGHEHLFGDPTGSAEWDRVFHQAMQLPIALLSVSTVVKEILARHFSRVAPVVPNAIDATRFFPPPAGTVDPNSDVKRVLIVGHPALPLKNFSTALFVLNAVHKAFPSLQVTWMCQQKPVVSSTTFPIEFVVNPPQADVPKVYRRGFHAFLFTSFYEAWGMPVMEAMATGIPVVTSKCYGVSMFCEHDTNCLMAEPTDTAGLSGRVIALLRDPKRAAKLVQAGLETVRPFTWDRAMTTLEDALLVAACRLGNLQSRLVVDPYAQPQPPHGAAAPGMPAVVTSPVMTTVLAPSGGKVASISFPPFNPAAKGPSLAPLAAGGAQALSAAGGWGVAATPLGLPPPSLFTLPVNPALPVSHGVPTTLLMTHPSSLPPHGVALTTSAAGMPLPARASPLPPGLTHTTRAGAVAAAGGAGAGVAGHMPLPASRYVHSHGGQAVVVPSAGLLPVGHVPGAMPPPPPLPPSGAVAGAGAGVAAAGAGAPFATAGGVVPFASLPPGVSMTAPSGMPVPAPVPIPIPPVPFHASYPLSAGAGVPRASASAQHHLPAGPTTPQRQPYVSDVASPMIMSPYVPSPAGTQVTGGPPAPPLHAALPLPQPLAAPGGMHMPQLPYGHPHPPHAPHS